MLLDSPDVIQLSFFCSEVRLNASNPFTPSNLELQRNRALSTLGGGSTYRNESNQLLTKFCSYLYQNEHLQKDLKTKVL